MLYSQVRSRLCSHTPIWLACLSGWFARLEPNLLLQYADELLAVPSERGFPYWHAFALMVRGWCAVALRQIEDGIELWTTGLAGASRPGKHRITPSSLKMLTDAHRLAGQPGVGLAYLAEAERLADETAGRWVPAETLRLRG